MCVYVSKIYTVLFTYCANGSLYTLLDILAEILTFAFIHTLNVTLLTQLTTGFSSFLPHQTERRMWCCPEGYRVCCWSRSCLAPHLTVQVSGVLRECLLLPCSLPSPLPGGSEEALEASPALSGLHRSPLPERSHGKGMKGG